MKLTKSDKQILTEWGYDKDDIAQIERASSKTVYEERRQENDNVVTKKVSAKRAIEVLGRKTFLSGLGRCAFHWSAFRTTENEDTTIFFDSSRFFLGSDNF